MLSMSQRIQQSYLDILYTLARGDSWTPPVPPPSLNFNQFFRGPSLKRYRKDFNDKSRELELPFLREVAGLDSKSVTLDFGCGLGRLASAFLSSPANVGTYLGWEPEPNALNWLSKAYKDFGDFDFAGAALEKNQNYVTAHNPGKDAVVSLGAVPSRMELERFVKGRRPDLVTSYSVFTHMWPEDTLASLTNLAQIQSREGIMVHTWLALDASACNSINSGKGDRLLPFEIEGIHTYSRENPLVCTAYPMDTIEEIYTSAGLEIQTILFGEWSGTGRKNPYSYQDVIVSKLT